MRKRLQRSSPNPRAHVADMPGSYQPRLTLTLDGAVEVYRFARFLEMAGLKNATWMAYHHLGVRVLSSMDRHEPGIVDTLASAHGPARVTYRSRRRAAVQLRLGMPEEELAQLEEAVR